MPEVPGEDRYSLQTEPPFPVLSFLGSFGPEPVAEMLISTLPSLDKAIKTVAAAGVAEHWL